MNIFRNAVFSGKKQKRCRHTFIIVSSIISKCEERVYDIYVFVFWLNGCYGKERQKRLPMMFCWWFIWDEERPCFPASLIIWSVAEKGTRVYSLHPVSIGTHMPSVCDDNEICLCSRIVLRETVAKTLIWMEIVFILKPDFQKCLCMWTRP